MPINIAKTNKTRDFQTYQAWKKAVKELDPKASFTGDKDIDSCFLEDVADCEWDGEKGTITFLKSKETK